MNFVDILYQMLRDNDAQVVSNCIAALSEILASEGGMIVNKKMAHYLLNRSDCTHKYYVVMATCIMCVFHYFLAMGFMLF